MNKMFTQNDNDGKMQTKHDFQDSLLASQYSQVEFLRGEIEDKNLLIRMSTGIVTQIIKSA